MNREFVAVTFSSTCGSDIHAIYFIQINDNVEELKYLERLIGRKVTFGCVYTEQEVDILARCCEGLYSGVSDNTEVLKLTGKMKLPDSMWSEQNPKGCKAVRHLIEKYLGNVKAPKWKNLIENVEDIGDTQRISFKQWCSK